MESKIIRQIEKNSDEMIKGIKKIVKMPSVETEAEENAPFGKDIALTLNETLKLAESLGFKTKNLDNYIGWHNMEKVMII